MAVKIRLKRMGKIRQPYYRIVIADSRKKRDGRVIEEIGKYHPKDEPSLIEVKSERAQYWLGVGAQPTEAVEAILKITGDWQKFKGEPGAEGTLKVKDAKRDKLEIFNEILKQSDREPKAAMTAKTEKPAKAAEPAPEPAAGQAPAEEPKAEEPAAEQALAEEPKAEEPKAEEPVAEESKTAESAPESAPEPVTEA